MTHRDAPRAGCTTWRLLARVLAPALLIGTLAPVASASSPSASGDSGPAWLELGDKGDHPARLDPSLHDDAERADRHDAGPAATDEVTVVVEATDAEAARQAIEGAGGSVDTALTDRVKGRVPAGELEGVATAAGVRRVREPFRLQPHVISEGVEETQADDWQTAAFDGTGTKVAILDAGFWAYSDLLGTELPATVETDFSRCGGEGETQHGKAVAEIVHDMAPGATLRLVCIVDDVDYVSALGTMAANGVDVVNGSFGFFAASRGDGSGGPSTINGATAALRDQGILYVASAGNSGSRHYNVNAVGDPTPAVAFANPDDSLEDFVNISDGDALEVTVSASGQALIVVSWDAWPVTRQDFDLYVGNHNCGLVGASDGAQDVGGGAPPVEGVFIDLSLSALPFACRANPQLLEVYVNRWAGAGTPRLDFFADGDIVGIEHVTGGSLTDPATSSAAFSVGAYCEATGAIQPYSSRGPTIDGRTKPDISGPDGTSSSVFGPQGSTLNDQCNNGFIGTSASAPHVSGAAALLLDANPLLDVAELQQVLVDRAQDAGTAGLDNSYGAGRLRLGTAGAAYAPTPQAFTPMAPTRLFDSRTGTQYPGEIPNRTTPIGPAGTVAVRVRGIAGIPADATAVALNVTAVSPTTYGWVAVFPGGPLPTVSNLNFGPGQITPVHVTATVGANDSVRLYNAAGNTHLVVDIAGWYGPTGVGGPSIDRLTALPSPERLVDTRMNVPLGYAEEAGGDRWYPVGPGETLTEDVTAGGVLPLDVSAVVLNITAIGPTEATVLIAHPGGIGHPRPTASNLNPNKGQTVANLVVVPVGNMGAVSVYNAAGQVHMAIDVMGYYRPGSGAGYVALDPPTRQLDTRTGTGLRLGALGANTTYNLKVARYDGVPADAAAVMLSVAAVGPSAGGWLAVYPGGTTRPNASNLNFARGQTLANAVLARFATGRVAFYNPVGSTHVISDLAGYFIDPANVQTPPP
jgi:Subtilase family